MCLGRKVVLPVAILFGSYICLSVSNFCKLARVAIDTPRMLVCTAFHPMSFLYSSLHSLCFACYVTLARALVEQGLSSKTCNDFMLPVEILLCYVD